MVVALVVAVIAVAGAVVLRQADRASKPAAVTAGVAFVAPTTLPYGARPGTGGTTLLTETVDPLTVAVPAGWKTLPADPLVLVGRLQALAAQVPPLAALLEAEGEVAAKGAVRLFAYQPSGLRAFVSVISFASPASKAFTAAGVAAVVASAQKKTPSVAVSGETLPVGEVIKLDSSLVSEKQGVVIEDLVFVAAARTILVEMVGETNVAAIPAVFAQIGQSLRVS